MSYSLVLHSLDSKPDRRALEEITVKVPSIARADAAGLLNDWYGIVCSNLPLRDAQAFQAGLRSLGCEADIVPDNQIPALHHDFRCQRLDIDGETIALTTAMNRRQVRNRKDLVFISAGLIDRERVGTIFETGPELRYSKYGAYISQVERRVMKIEEKRFFRIDLFFGSAPHRISFEMDKETIIRYGERAIRMKNTLDLTVLMVDLQALLPRERMNRNLREISTQAVYPSIHAYEEELRWEFYRLGAVAADGRR